MGNCANCANKSSKHDCSKDCFIKNGICVSEFVDRHPTYLNKWTHDHYDALKHVSTNIQQLPRKVFHILVLFVDKATKIDENSMLPYPCHVHKNLLDTPLCVNWYENNSFEYPKPNHGQNMYMYTGPELLLQTKIHVQGSTYTSCVSCTLLECAFVCPLFCSLHDNCLILQILLYFSLIN